MGDRQDFVEIRPETRPRTIRRGVGGPMEQHDAGSDQNVETGHDGSQRFPSGSSDYEEIKASEIDPVVRRVHDGGTDLYHYGINEERFAAGIPAG